MKSQTDSKILDEVSLSAGERSRREILKHAVDIASAEGLEGLTIGRLAKELGKSKSGLFAHFGSKEKLQLATIDAAGEIFSREIIEPSTHEEAGRDRLTVMVDRWLSYVEGIVFRGGCFFAAASAEFDGRPGPVREKIVELTKVWVEALESEVEKAQYLGQFDSAVEPRRFVFEIHAFVQEANWAFQLYGDSSVFDLARSAISARFTSAESNTL